MLGRRRPRPPDVQEPTPADILRRVRHLEIRSRRMVQNLLLGQYHSVFRGRGIEFNEVREYLPGDDIRIIDWNVTARMGMPYVKKFVEERELTVYLVVDVSASQGFTTAPQTKRDLAAEIGALLALSAVSNNDKVGLIAFSRDIEKFVPASKGLRHVLRILREILYLRPGQRGTDIAAAAGFLSRVAKRRSVVFLISDFLDQGYETALRLAARRHEIVAITIGDPREEELPPVGIVEMVDSETGERIVLDTSSRATRHLYASLMAQERERRSRFLRSIDVDEVRVSTHGSYIMPLVAFFKARAARG